MELLRVENLTAGYGQRIVLRNVNLTVKEHDFIAIIGPNGGGKSSLLKVMLGLLQPIQGNVKFSFPGGKKAIGYLPQLSLVDHKFPITIFDVVLSGLMSRKKLFAKFSRQDFEKTREILAQMGIDNLADKAIGEVSGGQRQRAFLCRALISSPEMLLLDEPNTFVDTGFETHFYRVLEELNQKMAILLVSHEIGVIAPYVKSIACVNETLHYHDSNEVTPEIVGHYKCPIDIITHGEIPHRVLKKHGDN